MVQKSINYQLKRRTKYHENPYRAVNFAKDADGNLYAQMVENFLFKKNTACEIAQIWKNGRIIRM